MNKATKITAAGVQGQIRAALEQNAALDVLNGIGMRTSSDSPSTTYGWLGQVPQMREWLGPRVIKQLAESSYTLINKKFEASLEIQKDDMMDDKTGSISARVAELAERPQTHWIKLVTDLVTANGTCYDGAAFFSASHSEGSSGTLCNLCTSSHISALDVTTAAAPTAAEMIDVILGIVGYFKSYKDDQGEPINENAKGFHFVAGTQAIYNAIFKAINQNIVSGVIDNPLKYSGLQLSCSLNPRFSALTTIVQAYRTDAYVKPFILQEREGIEIETLGEGSDYYVMNDAYLFGLKARRNAGYGMWQYAMYCTLS